MLVYTYVTISACDENNESIPPIWYVFQVSNCRPFSLYSSSCSHHCQKYVLFYVGLYVWSVVFIVLLPYRDGCGKALSNMTAAKRLHCHVGLWAWFDIQADCISLAPFKNIMASWHENAFRHGPLTRYVTLRVAHAPGMPGKFSPTPNSKEHAS